MRHRLTAEQRRAVASTQPRTFVEAGPGTGKTTVAAYRFGYTRFRPHFDDRRAVVALSFTRSATQELRERVTGLWGAAALSGQSRVTTIDSELVSLLRLLLRLGEVEWPGGLTEIEPLDSCEAHPSWKWNAGNTYRTYIADLRARRIEAVQGGKPRYRITKANLTAVMQDGICAHEDVRRIVMSALDDDQLRAILREHCRATVDHLIVDEVFDADAVDVELIRLYCEAGVGVTVLGDHWQALYEFRNAQPQTISETLTGEGGLDFDRAEVSKSHRYENEDLEAAAITLRSAGYAVPVGPGPVDIVIARTWKNLWNGPSWVLPASFGPVQNQTDALQSLLLDSVLRRELGATSRTRTDALLVLGLDPWTTDLAIAGFDSVIAELEDESEAAAKRSLAELRKLGPELGLNQAVRSLTGESEARAVARMQLLAARVNHESQLVAGVSAHQAKGCEWLDVGLILTPEEVQSVASGLDKSDERHRALYVALTRGSRSTARLS